MPASPLCLTITKMFQIKFLHDVRTIQNTYNCPCKGAVTLYYMQACTYDM